MIEKFGHLEKASMIIVEYEEHFHALSKYIITSISIVFVKI